MNRCAIKMTCVEQRKKKQIFIFVVASFVPAMTLVGADAKGNWNTEWLDTCSALVVHLTKYCQLFVVSNFFYCEVIQCFPPDILGQVPCFSILFCFYLKLFIKVEHVKSMSGQGQGVQAPACNQAGVCSFYHYITEKLLMFVALGL